MTMMAATQAPSEQPASTSGLPSRYTYSTLKDAYEKIEGGQAQKLTLNFYCTVLDCSSIRETKGTDMVCNLKVADGTTAEMGFDDGIEMVCFCAPSQQELMPIPNAQGDIIRMHRVVISVSPSFASSPRCRLHD